MINKYIFALKIKLAEYLKLKSLKIIIVAKNDKICNLKIIQFVFFYIILSYTVLKLDYDVVLT